MSKLVEKVRADLTAAIKGNDPKKVILRQLLAKFQMDNVQTDDLAVTCVRTLVNANKAAAQKTLEESAKHGTTVPQEYYDNLAQENKVLEAYMPAYLDAKNVALALLSDEAVLTAIHQAANEGAATGVAMKFFKTKNLPVEGNVVKNEVKSLRDAIKALAPLIDGKIDLATLNEYRNASTKDLI